MSTSENPNWSIRLSKRYDETSQSDRGALRRVDSPACLVVKPHPKKALVNISSLRVRDPDIPAVMGEIAGDFGIISHDELRNHHNDFIDYASEAVALVGEQSAPCIQPDEGYFLMRAIGHVFDRAEDMDPANGDLLRVYHEEHLKQVGMYMISGIVVCSRQAA